MEDRNGKRKPDEGLISLQNDDSTITGDIDKRNVSYYPNKQKESPYTTLTSRL
jgi:hypothetical protein